MNFKLIQKLYSIQEKIAYYNGRMMFSICLYAKNYYGFLIKKEIEEAQVLIDTLWGEKKKNNRAVDLQRQFTLEELGKYDGSNGKPAYVAIDGTVYDASLSSTWDGGTYFELYAGKDLTNEFKECYQGEVKKLKNLSIVGKLKA